MQRRPRLTLRGAVAEPATVRRAAAALVDGPDACLSVGSTTCFLEKLDVDVQERVDLASLAGTADPVGLLARRILALEGAAVVPGVADPAAWRAAMLREARGRLADIDAQPPFAPLDTDSDDATVSREILAAARAVLEHLRASKGGDRAPDPA